LVAVAPVDTTVEHRSLEDYDRMFGLAESNTAGRVEAEGVA
jgi:hypothetical protein